MPHNTNVTALGQELTRKLKDYSAEMLLLAKKLHDEISLQNETQDDTRLKQLFHAAVNTDRILLSIRGEIEGSDKEAPKSPIHLV